MKKFIAAAMISAFVTIAGASSAMAATATRPDDSTGAPAYQRCRAAGGTDHFCGELGGYWYFQ